MFTVKTARNTSESAPQVSMEYEPMLESDLVSQENVQSVVSRDGQQTTAVLQEGFVPLLADIATADRHMHYQSRQDGQVGTSQDAGDITVTYVPTETVVSEQVICEAQNETVVDPGSLASYSNVSILNNADGNYVIIQHPSQISLIPDTTGELQDAVANISGPSDGSADGQAQNIIISDQAVLEAFQTSDAEGTVVINELQGAGFNIDGNTFTDVTNRPRKMGGTNSQSSGLRVQKFSPGQLVSLGNSKKEIIDNIFVKSRLRVGRPKKSLTEDLNKPDSEPASSADTAPAAGDTPDTGESTEPSECPTVDTNPKTEVEVDSDHSVSGEETVSPIEEGKNETPENFKEKYDDSSSKIETENQPEQLNDRPKRKRTCTAKVKDMIEISMAVKGQSKKKKVETVKDKTHKSGNITVDDVTKTKESSVPVQKNLRSSRLSERISKDSGIKAKLERNNISRKTTTVKKGIRGSKLKQNVRQKQNRRQKTDKENIRAHRLGTTQEEETENRELDSLLIRQFHFKDKLVLRLPPVCVKTLHKKQLIVELDISNHLDVSQIAKKPLSNGFSKYSFKVSNCTNNLVPTDSEEGQIGAAIKSGSSKIGPLVSDVSGKGDAPDEHEPMPETVNSDSKESKLVGDVEEEASLQTLETTEDESYGADVSGLTVEKFMSNFNKEIQQLPGMCADAAVEQDEDGNTILEGDESKEETKVKVKAGRRKVRDFKKKKKAVSEIKAEKESKTADKDYIVRTTEDGKREFVCPQCGYFSKYSQNTITHMRAHSSEKTWVCEECGIPWKNKNQLQKHMIVHQQDRPFACPLCSQMFKSQRLYCCCMCNHESKSRQNMGVHMYQHTDERPYQCEVCGQTFKGPSNLSAHRRQHSTNLSYDCPMCNRKFRDRGTYKQHMRRHMGVKKHVCEHCGKSFVISSDLKKHIRVHTGEKPYECDLCGKRFGDGSGMVRHRNMHAALFKYQCSVCFKMFKRRDLCTSHVKKAHMADMSNDSSPVVVMIPESVETVTVETTSATVPASKEQTSFLNSELKDEYVVFQENMLQNKSERKDEYVVFPENMPQIKSERKGEYVVFKENMLKNKSELRDEYIVITENMPKNRFEQLTEEASRRLKQHPVLNEADNHGYIETGNPQQYCSEFGSQPCGSLSIGSQTSDNTMPGQSLYCDPNQSYYSNSQGEGHGGNGTGVYHKQGDGLWKIENE